MRVPSREREGERERGRAGITAVPPRSPDRKKKQTRSPQSPLPPLSQLPLLSIAAFGLYALALLAVGVTSFRDCPGDADALARDVKKARAALAARGVSVADK